MWIKIGATLSAVFGIGVGAYVIYFYQPDLFWFTAISLSVVSWVVLMVILYEAADNEF